MAPRDLDQLNQSIIYYNNALYIIILVELNNSKSIYSEIQWRIILTLFNNHYLKDFVIYILHYIAEKYLLIPYA